MSGATAGHGSERITHHVYHDWSRERPVGDTIVDAIAEREDVDAEELTPLDRSINPEALQLLFDGVQAHPPTSGSVSFSYEGYVVVVMSTGLVLLRRSPTE